MFGSRFNALRERIFGSRHGSGGESAKIRKLLAIDQERVETIERLTALDKERVETIERLSQLFHTSDGITVSGRNQHFLTDPNFDAAWNKTVERSGAGWPDGVPDIRWRAHIALWAARHALRLDGNFVECGVHIGLLSQVICHALKFQNIPKDFYLFDTFKGIPIDQLEDQEIERSLIANKSVYSDIYETTVNNFSEFQNVKCIKGKVPDVFTGYDFGKLSYISIDMNNVNAEKGAIETLWNFLVVGGIVLIDDYDWIGCEAQRMMWDSFATAHDHRIACLPTGQGLLIKT